MNLSDIIRLALTGIVLGLVWREAGTWTWLSIIGLAIANEIQFHELSKHQEQINVLTLIFEQQAKDQEEYMP